MSKHRKRWSTKEKLEIINYAKIHSVLKASREFSVSSPSIYKWMDAYDTKGESGLKGQKKDKSESLENKRLKRENDELKKIIAEKELRIRIQEAMLKKSR